MGIKGLMSLITDIKETTKKEHTGRTVAVDASIMLYQFLIQIRMSEDSGRTHELTDKDGNSTSHLQGFLNRVAGLLELGIRPIFVFDGKPPLLKCGTLAKRSARKEQAIQDLKDAEQIIANDEDLANDEDRDQEKIDAVLQANKAEQRSVRVTKEQNEEVKKLLHLLGIPVIQAPCEAEAQCAELCKKGRVYAVVSEDMDCLPLGSIIMLRHLMRPDSAKEPVLEISLVKVLKELSLNQNEFIDLCILCGSDYSSSIKGIGPKNALKLIKKHKSIEEVLKNLPEKYKNQVPEQLVNNLDIIRKLFSEPEVIDADEVSLRFSEPDRSALLEFLVTEKNFSEERVIKVIDRIVKARKGGSQSRIDNFFKPKSKSIS